jgi:hypothetical protein
VERAPPETEARYGWDVTGGHDRRHPGGERVQQALARHRVEEPAADHLLVGLAIEQRLVNEQREAPLPSAGDRLGQATRIVSVRSSRAAA